MSKKFPFIFSIVFLLICFKAQPQKLIIRNDFLRDSASIINNYYKSDSLINACNNELKKIDTNNVEMIIVYGFYLDNVEKNTRQINEYELPLKLDLLQNDPLHINERFNYLFPETLKWKTIVGRLKSTLDNIYYHKGLANKAKQNFPEAIESFKNSIKINQTFAPACFQLSELYLKTGQLKDAGNTLKEAYSNKINDSVYNDSIILIAQKIILSFVAKSDSLIKQEHFNDAITLLEDVFEYYKIPWFNHKQEVERSMAAAKYGIYNSYLKIAQKALSKNKLDLAETYIGEAVQYQSKNTTYILNNSKIDAILISVVNFYIGKGYKLNKEGKYRKALEYFNKSKELFLKYNVTPTNALIEGINTANNGIYQQLLSSAQKDTSENISEKYQAEILKNKPSSNDTLNDTILTFQQYQQLYQIIVEEGKKYLEQSNNLNALNKFIAAKNLNEKYHLYKDSSLASYLKDAAKPVLIEKIKSGYIKAWGNDLETAKSILNNSFDLQKEYFLTKDSVVNKTIATLKQKIVERECANVQDEYDRNLEKANRQVKELNFLDAKYFYDKAIHSTQTDTFCGVDSSSAVTLRKKYERPVIYQKLIAEAKTFLNDKNYKLFIEKYLNAGTFFFLSNVSDYGLEYISLCKFVAAQNNLQLSDLAINYFTDKNELTEALSLLSQLKNNGFLQDSTILIQEKLGKQLAKRDFKNNAFSNPKENIISYTNEDKWFKYLKAAYLKFWGKND